MSHSVSAALDRRCIEEAHAWTLLGTLLERPAGGWKQRLEALLAGETGAELGAAARIALTEAAEGSYHRLLGPGGVASPRRIAHAAWEEPGQVMARIRAYYQAFAYEPPHDEPPDHAAALCAFLAWLHLKEAFALARGEAEHAETTRMAAQKFREEHVAPVAAALAEKALASGDHYLNATLAALARRAGPVRAPVAARVHRCEPSGCAFDCDEAAG